MMKFSDFKTNAELLTYFGIRVNTGEFIDFNSITPIEISPYLKEDLSFLLINRGDTDMEFYACEALIFPLLKEAWKRNPKVKLFSHPQIKYEDLVLVPDYVVTPKDKVGLNTFQKPLLITVEAKNDDYARGWSDAYRQLVVARLLNGNNEIPIYVIVSIGEGWQIGKLDDNVIHRHPTTLALASPDKLLGVLDYIFADCVRTAERFGMYD
jgi:hypothetical protein